MILGIGIDTINIDRIQGVLDRYGDRFRNRVFSKNEKAKAASRWNEANTFAKRWAAKEACSKALGTGLRMGISWRDMSVNNLQSGKPTITVTGWAKRRLNKITPKTQSAIIHVSITDDYPWAHATVIIETQPLN